MPATHRSIQYHVHASPGDAIVSIVVSGVMFAVVFSREHDSVGLQELHRSRHGWEVGPFVQLVGHHNRRKQGEKKGGYGRVRGRIEKDDHRNQNWQADKNIVSIDGDKVATGHFQRVNVMVSERLHELLPDHRGGWRSEIVEQKMNNAGQDIGDGVTGDGRNHRHQRSWPERARCKSTD